MGGDNKGTRDPHECGHATVLVLMEGVVGPEAKVGRCPMDGGGLLQPELDIGLSNDAACGGRPAHPRLLQKNDIEGGSVPSGYQGHNNLEGCEASDVMGGKSEARQ